MNQSQALNILKTGANVFLTGEPGSGKTYTINKYVEYLRTHGIEPAITASTGIAATHIGGMTIHSWAGIGIKDRLTKTDLKNIATNKNVEKRVRKAKILIIDEISMLPPKTLEMVEMVCRAVKGNSKPFGGVQVVLVGDFFQLPPIIKNSSFDDSQDNLFEESPVRFAYGSPAFTQAEFATCYITEQYRQDDDQLISVLSKIRTNNFDETALAHIQKRSANLYSVPEFVPKLFSHNVDVDQINNQMLDKLKGEEKQFLMESMGFEPLLRAMKKGCLSPEILNLKAGASVMFTKNNTKEGYVNGTLGVVEKFDKESGLPVVKTRSGRMVTAGYVDWTVEENGHVRGRLTQLPLRLAWAITVHKSQGISLDEAVIDLSKVFEFGQGYVAISRVRRLSGIYILGISDMAFQVDPEVLKKDREFFEQSEAAERGFAQFSDDALKKMQEEFIALCGGTIEASKAKSKNLPDTTTYDETLKLWKEGKGIPEIAKLRNLVETTVLGHLEKLAQTGKINRSELVRIIPPRLLADLPKIHAAFKRLETTKLSPVFDYFAGKFSYETLFLARMTMD